MIFFFKTIILSSIFFISIKIGFLKANTYNNRVNELKSIKNSLEMLKSKIEFTYEPIKDIFLEISNIIYENKKNVFLSTVNNMKELEITSSWTKAIQEDNNLIEEDKSTIKMFGKLLGKTDKLGQINEIIVMSKLIDILIEKAEIEKNKNYKLFKTLGTVVGIGLCIILV